MKKLAIIASHPIQYYAPWFRYLASTTDLSVKVFYLWDFGVNQQIDAGFKQPVLWDIPLLTGYEYEFVPNVSSRPGTHHFWGLKNPSLLERVRLARPDVVLLMNYNYASLYNFFCRWERRIPLIFRGDSHRIIPDRGIKSRIKQQLISLIYQRFSACLYVGKANYDYLRQHGVSEERLFSSPHAIDNDRFSTQTEAAKNQAKLWKQELGISENHAIILFAGKFESKKRPLDLLKAFLQADLPQVSLLFVGAGILEQELRFQAATHPNIYFAPFQNQTLMPRTYAAGDLVVLPSYGSSETWGLAINEAMCMSLPVIASTHVGCAADLIQPNKNGLIFPAGDVAALAHCLQVAFSDRNRLKSWGEESRRIVNNYSYTQTTQGLEAALKYVGRCDRQNLATKDDGQQASRLNRQEALPKLIDLSEK